MPNVTSIEPQVLLDLLALNLYHEESGGTLAAHPSIALISPWLSDVELSLRPSAWQSRLGAVQRDSGLRLGDCLRRFCAKDWNVQVAVLKYGQSPSGLSKASNSHLHERQLLRGLKAAGARVFLCPDLHAKGIVTPLGVISGSTNYTHSGMHLQMQNANFFAFDHPDFETNRRSLMLHLRPEFEVSSAFRE
jgi:hypothetical protein